MYTMTANAPKEKRIVWSKTDVEVLTQVVNSTKTRLSVPMLAVLDKPTAKNIQLRKE